MHGRRLMPAAQEFHMERDNIMKMTTVVIKA